MNQHRIFSVFFQIVNIIIADFFDVAFFLDDVIFFLPLHQPWQKCIVGCCQLVHQHFFRYVAIGIDFVSLYCIINEIRCKNDDWIRIQHSNTSGCIKAILARHFDIQYINIEFLFLQFTEQPLCVLKKLDPAFLSFPAKIFLRDTFFFIQIHLLIVYDCNGYHSPFLPHFFSFDSAKV